MLNSYRNRLAIQLASILLAAMTNSAGAQMEIKPTHPNGEVSLIVDFEVKPGFEAEFETFSRRSIACSRLEPGNIAFDIHRDTRDGRRYVLYEVWRSPAALQAHFAEPYTKALFAMFDRALTRPVTEGGLRFIADLLPSARSAPATGEPSANPDCR